ncbi:MAG: glycosyltransferase [Patescibacteria group bacterium]
MKQPKVCLVHDYLVQYGGAEKTLEAFLEIFPQADIFTSTYKAVAMSSIINKSKVVTIGNTTNKLKTKIPILSKYLTFLNPIGFENFDLSNYDIVVSDSSSYAKGVITKPEQLHISYIHTPPRFLYKYSVESTKRDNWYYKPIVKYIDHYLRIWDFLAAQRADYIVCNSYEVKKRIAKFYKRDATVIYPPVEVEKAAKKHEFDNLEEPFYLTVGRLSAYKNVDMLVEAFNLLGIRLKVVGTGSEEKRLKKMAKPNVAILGKVSEKEKHRLLAQCKGFLFPVVEEDFGIGVIEAMAHGKPILAHKSGGPLETIRDGIDGMFFDSIKIEHFMNQVKKFDENIRQNKYDSEKIKAHAMHFNKNRFKQEFEEFVKEKWEGKNSPEK